MKKVLLTIAAFAAVSVANAQQLYNYFDPADCDANGWLWFDTQAKIDKYLGYYDPELLKTPAELASPKLYMIDALCESEPGINDPTFGDPTIKGYNAEGVQGGEGSRTGALVLAAGSSSLGSAGDGGSFIVWLPDCAQMDLELSQDYDVIAPGLLGGMGWVEDVDLNVIKDYKVLGSWVKPLSRTYTYSWMNMQNLENANEVTCHKIGQPLGQKVTAKIRQNINTEMLIHGIRILQYTDNGHPFNPGSGVAGIEADENAPVEFFNMQGMKVSGNEPGMYIRRQGSKTAKVIVK